MNVHQPNMDEAADLKSITLLGLDSSSFKLLSSCSKNVTVFPGEELLDRVGGEGEAILSLRLLQASLLLLERSAEELSFAKTLNLRQKTTLRVGRIQFKILEFYFEKKVGYVICIS